MIDREIEQIKKLEEFASKESFNSGWMGYCPSRAFLVSLGAGPWRRPRRKVVQEAALEWFSTRYHDLCAIPDNHPRIFPLDWQNDFLRNMISSLKKEETNFASKCRGWKKTNDWESAAIDFFGMCGVGANGTKVLWMFARDFLELPSFPVDRHVKRALNRVGLPHNVWHLIAICRRAGIDPNDLNRRLFVAKAENEDFSHAVTLHKGQKPN